MKQPAPNRVQTTVRLPADLLEAVDKAADREDISRTAFVVRALRRATKKTVELFE